jgi:ribonuclease HI
MKKGVSRNKKMRMLSFKYVSSGSDVVSKIRQKKRETCMMNKSIRKQSYELPPWWNNSVEAAWREKKLAVTKWRRAVKVGAVQGEISSLKEVRDCKVGLFKVVAKEAKADQWSTFCNKVAAERSLALFWRCHRAMNGPRKDKRMCDFQRADLTWCRSDEEKGTAFLCNFLSQLNCHNRDVNSHLRNSTDLLGATLLNSETSITPEEIREALRISGNTAPGPDGIRYGDLRGMTDEEVEELCSVFNNSLASGEIDREWLHSYLVPLPKPGKDLSRIQGYRIITMQNTIGKLLEKLVARKMVCQLETRNLLPPTLGGYRPNRETWANAAVFAQEVYEGFHQHRETCAVAIDLEDAYNRVSLDFLVDELKELQFDPVIIRWINSALSQREVVLRCGSWASKPVKINPGLPQGSPLSPVLFNIYTWRVTGLQISGMGRTLSYADDILVYRQGSDKHTMVNDVQIELDRIGDWCRVSGAAVNPSKVTVTWFSLNNHIGQIDTPSVDLGGKKVQRTGTMKYLGVCFDRCLGFKDHVDHVILRARKGLAAMRVMTASGFEQRLLVLLCQGLVFSVIDYALAILTISKTQTERLERIQNEAMRIILGCTGDTSTRAMRFLLDYPTMQQRVQLCQARAYLRISANKGHPLHSDIGKVMSCRLKRGKSWLGRAEEVIQQVCLLDDVSSCEEWVNVPDTCRISFRVVITLDRSSRNSSPVAVEAEVQALISENSKEGDVIIFTDGSVVRHVRSAWGFVAFRGGLSVREDSGAFPVTTSSMTMEVKAVSRAMVWLETQDDVHVVFLSDSMSMLRKVQTGCVRNEWLRSLEKSRLQCVTFIFVPGHAGVKGNERADALASLAVLTEGPAMDRSDIVNALCDLFRSNDAIDDIDSTSMSRMAESGIRCGCARQERYVGFIRSVVNQHRTGTVSRRVLAEILKRKSERLWTWSERDEDDLSTN